MKVISVTPAGRRRYVEILASHLLKHRLAPGFNRIDEHHWWLNTTNPEDISYIYDLCNKYPDFFKAVPARIPVQSSNSIYHFFEEYTDPDAMYIRFDDDIVWMASDAVEKLVKFRLANPDYFLVFANTINNAICSHLHHRIGALDSAVGVSTYNVVCPIGWQSPEYARHVHDSFRASMESGSLDKFKFKQWIMWENPRFSINCFAWLGRDLALVNGQIGTHEERYLSYDLPRKLKKVNVICGEALVVHYAFKPQREKLEEDDSVLNFYRVLADTTKVPTPSSSFVSEEEFIPYEDLTEGVRVTWK